MMSSKKVLENKVAIVTGGSRGIGAAIAKRLAQEGSHVVITYQKDRRSAEKIVKEIHSLKLGKAFALQADSLEPEQVRSAVQDTVEAFGHIDILVNNAGIAKFEIIQNFSLDDFNEMVKINIQAPFVASKEAALQMKTGGRIIMIGSVNAEKVHYQGGSVYAMTKAALVGLTKGLARDLGPLGITVNNIQPGPIETDLNPSESEFAELTKQFMAFKRYGKVEDVASLAAFLASPDASYISGASYTIDGGFLA